MKPTYIIILALGILSISCSPKTVVLTEENVPEDIFYLKDEIKPFTGTCHIYFHNTKILKEELNFTDGILHGQRVSYYKNGQVKKIGTYKAGRYDGTWTGYCKEGNKIFEVEYENDTLTGNFISWYNSGVIKEKGLYEKNAMVGEWVRYDESGMILSRESM
jgi:antitoxin component YwqK of YwqJK toxin-antitoxin module